MFKKLLVVSAVLAASSTVALAGHSYKGERDYKAEVAPCPVTSFMAGPYVGLSVGPKINISNAPAAFTGFNGDLSLGYGMLVTPEFYLAAEIFGGGAANLVNYKTDDAGVSTSYEYGIDILPGVLVTNNLLAYLRLGAVQTYFDNVGVSKTGWQAGLGFQTNVYQNWDLRTEYIYTGFTNKVDGAGRPHSQQANLGVVYKFL